MLNKQTPVKHPGDLAFALQRLLSIKSLTGYEACKILDNLAKGWSHQQIYRCFTKYKGIYWDFTLVPQEGKPDKKVYWALPDAEQIALPKELRIEVACNVCTRKEIYKMINLLITDEKRVKKALEQAGTDQLKSFICNVELTRLNGEFERLNMALNSSLNVEDGPYPFILASVMK
ncbi:transcriptional regulator [Vibrio phage BONAISHI]|nr:transcriptional regulator [Vibrio phage BONAISHI]